MFASANPARTNPTSVDTKGLGKLPPLKNTESEFVSLARRTKNFVVSVHPGARATVAESNAATEVVMPLDIGFWIWRVWKLGGDHWKSEMLKEIFAFGRAKFV